jgi:hypothetical protein
LDFSKIWGKWYRIFSWCHCFIATANNYTYGSYAVANQGFNLAEQKFKGKLALPLPGSVLKRIKKGK